MGKIFASFIALALLADVGMAQAQPQNASSFPERLIRIVVPYPAGGTADVLPRIIAEKLRQRWNQSIIVENRSGAGGNIGAHSVATAEPDGHTWLATPPGPVAINAALYKSLPYDPAALEPVIVLAAVPNVLVVRPGMPARTMQELIEYGRANPGKINYASQGNGTTSHLTAEMFQGMTGIKMTHVPYKGTAPALMDLAGNIVDIMFDNLGSSLPLHNSGQLRILAVGSAQRVPSLPEIPSIQELGVKDFESVTWFSVLVPPKTPEGIVRRINDAVNEVLKLPEVRDQFITLGAQPVGGSPADMAKFVAAERKRWTDVIRAAKINTME